MRYAVVIEKAEGNYSAYVPDLPGCVSTGRTVDEARRNLREAVALHLQGMREDRDAIPEPATQVAYMDVGSGPSPGAVTTNAPRSRTDIYLAILSEGLLAIRVAGWASDAAYCAEEADHLHNLPSLLANITDENLHVYYWRCMRNPGLADRPPHTEEAFRRLWAELDSANRASPGFEAALRADEERARQFRTDTKQRGNQ